MSTRCGNSQIILVALCFFQNIPRLLLFSFFFFNDTATTEIYTLSLHDALPISLERFAGRVAGAGVLVAFVLPEALLDVRSEEHTSELQSRSDLVCRLLLEKKKKKKKTKIEWR